VALRAKEFDLHTCRAPGRAHREQLLNLSGLDFYGQTRTVDVHRPPARWPAAA
jgi:hypothetical protein